MAGDLNKIEQEIARLTQAKNDMIAKDKDKVLAEINEKIQFYGISPKEIKFGSPKRKLQREQVKAMFARDAAKKKSNSIEKVAAAKPAKQTKGNGKLPPKYKLGDQVWSGMARKPQWVKQHLANGGKLADIQIQ
jgi:DNA-binding protein H-NS